MKKRADSGSPWIESPQPPLLEKSTLEVVEFPEEDETAGEILVGFLGPNCNDVVSTAAMSVLLVYLTGSSVSVLENVMVEKEELASGISTWWDARPNCVVWFSPNSVATEKLEFVEKRLFEILKDVAAKPLDMSYLKDCVRREQRQLKFQAESSGEFFSSNIINDFLFGNRDGSTLKDLQSLSEYEIIENWTEFQWKDFLRQWISDANHVSILGKPSKKMAEHLKESEVARIAARKEKLGEEGLAMLSKKLADAKAKNDEPIPRSVLEQWPVPGVDSIHFIESIPARSGLARDLGVPQNSIQQVIDNGPQSPLFLQFEHVPTNFVTLTILFGTTSIPLQYRPLLPLFIDNFFNTPILHDGQKIEFEQVVIELEKDTISYSMMGGSRVGDSEGITIQFQVEAEKYAKAVEWIKTLMFQSVFDEIRLKAGITKILADIPDSKRSGNSMLYAVDGMIHLAPESAIKARNTLVKGVYMKRLKKLLEKDPEAVIAMLEAVRSCLFQFENMRVLVIANIKSLPEPVKSWDSLVSSLDTSKSLLPIVQQWKRLNKDGQNPGQYGAVIVPMTTIDSSFCISSARGPTSYTDPQLAALMVAVSYLDAVEGPLWTAVRGTGLAYGTGFSRDLDGGFIQFRVYRSPDAHKAFSAAKSIVEAYVSGDASFEDHALEGAVSGIVVAMADEQPTMASAAQLSFTNSVVRGLPADYNKAMLQKIREVDVEQIKQAMRDILIPAFVPGKANVVMTCAPIMEEVSTHLNFLHKSYQLTCIQSLKRNFEASGFKTQVQPLSHFQEDYGLQNDGEEADDDDDDDDEDMEDGSDESDGSDE